MTTYRAIETARDESTMYRQGRGWVVSRFSHHHKAWWLSQEMPHALARQHLTECRVDRALQLLGWDDHDANGVAMECTGRFEDVVRAAVG